MTIFYPRRSAYASPRLAGPTHFQERHLIEEIYSTIRTDSVLGSLTLSHTFDRARRIGHSISVPAQHRSDRVRVSGFDLRRLVGAETAASRP